MRKPKTDLRVDVPDRCFLVKNQFYSRPSPSQIKAWKDEIGRVGDPHLLDAHTHTRPPIGSKPIYLDTFDLPSNMQRLGYLAPCPCCTPRHRKYGKDGKIAWFESEGVVRMLGPDCFAALDPEGHAAATEELAARKKRERDVAYLLKHHQRHVRAREILIRTLPIGKAVNDLAHNLRKTFDEKLDIPIWDHIQRGQLLYKTSEIEFDPATGAKNEIFVDALHAQIGGFKMFKPNLKNFELRLQQCIDSLHVVAREDWSDCVERMSEIERDRVARSISGAVKTARGLFQELRDLQTLVTPLTVNTLKAWGQREGSACSMSFYRKGDRLFIARSPGLAHFYMVIPEAFENELLDLDAPTLSDPIITDR